MKREIYKPKNFRSRRDLSDFLSIKYGSNNNFKLFLEDYKKAFDYCCTSQHINFYPIVFYKDDKIVAHVALIIDDRLEKSQAFFGFFEIVEDENIFRKVWGELTSLAKTHGISILKGPVNGSIWHQYRCIKEDSSVPFFKTEPVTPGYYHDFLSQVNPAKEVTYSSGIRESYSDILEMLQKHKKVVEEKLKQGGFEIIVKKGITSKTLLSIYHLSNSVFSEKSWGFTKLETNEFLDLYDSSKINENVHKLYTLYRNGTLVGYCSTMKEGRDLVCKTICVANEYQGKGLGNALALRIHEDAESERVEKIMYVLVKDGNQVHNYPTEDINIFRRYSAFEFELEI